MNTITGGISNSGTIQGGTNAIYVDPSSSIDLNMTGQHARVKGKVDATDSNFNITSGATFTSDGAFDVKKFDIASNAVFNMADTIIAHDIVTNEGTLSVGNTSQTITSDNGYIQNTGGVFQTEISDDTHYGRLAVDHNVDLSQSGNINVQLTPTSTIHSGEIFSNIIRGETLTEPTDGFNVTTNSFIWNFASTTANDAAVDLIASINSTAYNACQGSYCQGAANTILGQVAAGNAAFDPYNSLATEAAFKAAASQTTPELTNENNQTLQFITRSIMNVVPMWSTLRGESERNALSYQPGKVWFKPYAGTMTQSAHNSVPGFNATAYGMVVGRDTQLTNDWLVGGALSAGKDNMHGNVELNGQSLHSDTYEGMLYGVRKFPNNLYFAGEGLVGYGYNTTSRAIPLYSSTATGSYNSWFADMDAQLGWHYALNQNLVLTPEFDVNYLFVNQGSYKESGSIMDLSVNAQNYSSLVVGAYGHAAYHLTTFKNEQELTLTGYAGIARDVLNNEPHTTAGFTAGGPSFSTYGIQPNGFVLRAGTGLTYENPRKPLSVNVNYDLQTGNNAYSGAGVLRVVYKIA